MSFRPRSQLQMSRPEKETGLPMPLGSPKLKRQRLPSRLLSRKTTLVLSLVIVLLLVFPVIGKLRHGLCGTSSLFMDSGFCPAILANIWHLFYHLGGNGPWIPRVSGVEYSNASLPKHCSVDQVHMLSRHAERYPTKNAGARHFDLLDRLQKPDVELTGALSFLKSWEYFTDPEDPAFENLTATGPYAGTQQAFNTGKMLRELYDHLVPRARRTKFWSCSSGRDIETAMNFADGFFGSDWHSDGSAELVVIPEDADRGADTLTPGDTCYKYRRDGYGHDYGYGKLELWQKVFTEPIIDRLSAHAQGARIDHLDVYSMMEMCGFEILAKGSSPWCAVFTQEEWLQFEYARDLLHFYRAGPGNSYAGAMGWLWLNATQNLMSNRSSKDVYFSFVHDGDIVPVMATLQILNERVMLQELPTTHMKADRRWRTSDVVPMGGRLIFERIACQTDPESTGELEHFVRLFVNDGLMKLPGLHATKKIEHGVRLEDFQNFVLSRKETFGDFREVCALPENSPDRITFLHQ